MADPISITGLALQIGSIIKTCYGYGKAVKHAQDDIIKLCGELASLKSVLSDLQDQNEDGMVGATDGEIHDMLLRTARITDKLSKRLETGKSTKQRVLQSLKFPLEKDEIKQMLLELERVKSWFLLALMTEQRSQFHSHGKSLKALAGMVEDDIAHRRGREESKAFAKLRDLLAPVSPDTSHRKACESWTGTGRSTWFLDGPVKEWLESDDSESSCRLKVLVGKSGAGKTTLISQAVERCREYAKDHSDVHLAYFYCSFNNASSQERRNIVGSFLLQLPLREEDLLAKSDSFSGDLEADVVVERLEAELLNTKGKILLILDAVNESVESMKLFQTVTRLASSTADIRCLISTTSIPAKFNVDHAVVTMPAKLVDQDIEAYIRARHAQDPVLHGVTVDELLVLAPRADGMFRWADCQLSVLTAQLTPKLVRRALKELSGDLNETYTAILSRIPRTEMQFVKSALLWLSFARRPLTLAELCEAIVVEEGDNSVDDSCRISPQQRLLELSRGLVVWDQLSSHVSLAHSSVRTFLIGEDIRSSAVSSFALDEVTSQRSIVRLCLTYLKFRDFRSGYCESKELPLVHQMYPLLSYASFNWALHTKSIQRHLKEDDLRLIDSFFPHPRTGDQGSNFTFWINCLIPTGSTRQSIILKARPLYYLASFSLDVCIERLISQGQVSKSADDSKFYLDDLGGRKWSTALQVACVRGTPRTVEMLLAAGADPNSCNSDGRTCLFWALRNRRPEIVQLLQDYGASSEPDTIEPLKLKAKTKSFRRPGEGTGVPENSVDRGAGG